MARGASSGSLGAVTTGVDLPIEATYLPAVGGPVESPAGEVGMMAAFDPGASGARRGVFYRAGRLAASTPLAVFLLATHHGRVVLGGFPASLGLIFR
jgi:hypothetical protein